MGKNIHAKKKISDFEFDRVGKKPGKFEKTHGNGKNWFLPGKTGKIAFF
jgi:hypothetical protein